tara:strand:+ start:894 stop:2261 length:1368 start_codon:yes stop_codon:yes gene_type:complete
MPAGKSFLMGTLSDQARERFWIIGSLLLILLTALFLRYASGISGAGPRFDEKYITIPMFELMESGWSVETAIDYEETKGPALIWPYALLGNWFGGDLAGLRQVSCLLFVLSGIPLLLLSLRCGVTGVNLLLAMLGFMLLPYELVLSQLVMGEVSFVFGALFLVLSVLWGVGGFRRSDALQPERGHPVAGPIVYCLLLFVLLHSRVHAVALAGAACLAVWQLSGIRSWPWWLASIVAGLLRIPLWVRWGGLVSPEYQNLHGLGFRLESLTYLGAALVPLVGVFLIVFLWRYRYCRWWFLAPLGALLGLVLAVVAMPDLSIPEVLDTTVQHDRYQGVLATAVLLAGGGGQLTVLLLGFACVIGLASLGAFAALAFELPPDEGLGLLARLQVWALIIGCGLYMLTRGFVFDRFLLVWAVALSILWCRLLPRWLLGMQLLAMLVIAGRLVGVWLWQSPA